MRTKLKITEGIFPMPVLMVATYNEDGSVNVMNAAWGTMQERDTVALNLTETHKTVQNIKARGAFTVSIADAAHIVEADYFGVESGNKVADKFARSGLTASKAETVDAPVINEFPICLECRFIEYQNNEYGCGVIGKVVNVTADESVMVDGKIDMSKVNAIAFAPYHHGRYDESKSAGNWRSFYSIVVYNEISHTSNYIGTDHCLKFFLPIDCCHSLAIFWKEERFFP